MNFVKLQVNEMNLTLVSLLRLSKYYEKQQYIQNFTTDVITVK